MTTAQTPEDTLTRSRAQTDEWILVRRFVDPNAPRVRKRYRASVAAMLDVPEKQLSEHLASSSGEQPMNGWLCRFIDTKRRDHCAARCGRIQIYFDCGPIRTVQ